MITNFLTKVTIAAIGIVGTSVLGVQSASALSLTNANDSGVATGTPALPQAFFQQTSSSGAGTGALNSFLRLQAPGGPNNTETGYNTDNRPVQFNENTDPNFTRSLLLSSIPQVTLSGVVYREFVLDLNEPGGGQSSIDLTALRIFQSAAANPTPFPFTGVANAIYNLTETVFMNDLNSGSGSIDYAVYIPNSFFNADPYVTLYSTFENAQGGFEEWAVNKGAADNQVPTPALLPGLFALGAGALRKRKQRLVGAIA
jgi:hypothetical protein